MVPRTQRTASGVGVARSGHLESTHGVDARCRRETSTQEVDRDIEGMPRGRPGCERWMRSRGWPADQVRERPSWRRESVVARGRGGDADDRRRASDPARSRVTSARRCAARVRRSITASPHSTPRAQSAAPTRALVPLSGAAVRTCSWAAAAAWSNASTTAAVREGAAPFSSCAPWVVTAKAKSSRSARLAVVMSRIITGGATVPADRRIPGERRILRILPASVIGFLRARGGVVGSLSTPYLGSW